jgi:hypothetical protein
VRDVSVTWLIAQLARQLEPAFAAKVNVDERDVWPQFSDLPKRLSRGPGASDDIKSLFHKQPAHFLSEARVVVDDQAAQCHITFTMPGTAAPHHW